jgi:hypothetical protein
MSNPQLAKLVPEHGPRLLALSCDLMWATAWMQDANEVIAPLLGLPELPVVDLPDAPERDEAGVLHWKTRALIETAAGRPFIWVDDEITDLDRHGYRRTTADEPYFTVSILRSASSTRTSPYSIIGCGMRLARTRVGHRWSATRGPASLGSRPALPSAFRGRRPQVPHQRSPRSAAPAENDD